MPTLWVDQALFSVRPDAQVVSISFAHHPPGIDPPASCEIARIATTIAHFKKMIEVMCKVADYYPTRPAP
jgi:D-mannonate dehydratase